MARETELSGEQDLRWLRDVHCRAMPLDILFAILTGNEDAPERVEGWRCEMPDYDQAPDYVWTAPWAEES